MIEAHNLAQEIYTIANTVESVCHLFLDIAEVVYLLLIDRVAQCRKYLIIAIAHFEKGSIVRNHHFLETAVS